MLANLLRINKVHEGDLERRAIAAKNLLDDPMFIETLETLENRYFKQFYDSKFEDQPKREEAYIALRVCKEIKLHLSGIVKNDKFRDKKAI